MSQGDVLNTTFVITNHYTSSVEITNFETGCSCRNVVVSRKHIGPGERTEVRIRWEIGTKRGKVVDAVWIIHSAPAAKSPVRTSLQLEADVVPDIEYKPREVAFRFGEAGTARVKLSSGRVSAFKVKDTNANLKALSVRYSADSSHVEIRYTPSGELDAGDWFAVVENDSPHEPRLRIPVKIERP